MGSNPSSGAYDQKLLASHRSMNFESFQRTDISTHPTGPALDITIDKDICFRNTHAILTFKTGGKIG